MQYYEHELDVHFNLVLLVDVFDVSMCEQITFLVAFLSFLGPLSAQLT